MDSSESVASRKRHGGAEDLSRRDDSLETERPLRIVVPILWTALLSVLFAKVEIHIEGANGWASALPTWRIEHSVFAELFWGGKIVTGYHVWAFSFMFAVFHLPHCFAKSVTLRTELRILALIMMFWVTEDFAWFVMNPYFSLANLTPEHVPWHRYWLVGVPVDYFCFYGTGAFLYWLSFTRRIKYLKDSP